MIDSKVVEGCAWPHQSDSDRGFQDRHPSNRFPVEVTAIGLAFLGWGTNLRNECLDRVRRRRRSRDRRPNRILH